MQCEISRKFFDMLSAISAGQKVPVECVDGQVLYHAELDLLERIEQSPRANVSMLSHQSGVTRSAITQMSAKLLEKGLIEKYQSPDNKKEIFFRITPQGETVRAGHLSQHRDAADEMRQYLCALDAGEKKTILAFMEKMTICMPVCVFPCQCDPSSAPCHLAADDNILEELC